MISKKGFTLIELLVVVLIIGVLTAVALPKYQRAVMKSRFATVMPTAKSIATAQESFFQARGRYAANDEKDALDVQVPPSGANVLITLSDTKDYDYVLAQRTDIPELHYIQYQGRSQNYRDEIHCEALSTSDDAKAICAGMSKMEPLGQTVSAGYLTYVLEGTGAGLPPAANDNTPSCDKADAMGLSCTMSENAQGQQVKKVCATAGAKNYCSTTTYDEEGGYTRVQCKANSDGVCTGSWYSYTYDENGNQLTQRYCQTFAADGSCSAYSNSNAYDYTYDANGNKLTERTCSTVAADGSCSAYAPYANYDYTYDANGNQLTSRSCSTVAADGSCSAYSHSDAYDYTYDANGNKLTVRNCSAVAADGSCSAYSNSNAKDYTYDANGNRLTERTCSTVAADGSCSAYSNSSAYDYTYDANGNKLTSRYCSTVAADGSCSAYSASRTDYTYDANGNQLTQRTCSTVAADGSCSVYSNSSAKDYTYDANGNKLTQRTCSTVAADGSCSVYSSTYIYAYDDNGTQLGSTSCSGNKIDPATGNCI